MEKRAKKRFGQHFLHSQGIIEKILRASQLSVSDKVLEIGPGLGALTKRLHSVGCTLQLVELDRDMADHVRDTWPDISLHEGDACKIDWVNFLPGDGWKCVSNLPYNVGTGIVTDLVSLYPKFSRLVVMLQLEVAKRMTAKVGERNRGSLATFIDFFAEAEIEFRVPKGAFHPPPKVESAVLNITLRESPYVSVAQKERLESLLMVLYSQPRKTIRNCLRTRISSDEADFLLQTADVDPRRRSSTLQCREIIKMLDKLEKISSFG
ncbi:MAG: 16S rRNA (adenine(1518)-N(6)/adenine(1519)-N(6))-dimethyltransferase RsmA [Myxococcota bacterium]|nr:16S rRNA (adenine(1518)-N(6)/adenine(1519)-N(6))-dimethyltransferase RsmA [Myxococcota bacterium]